MKILVILKKNEMNKLNTRKKNIIVIEEKKKDTERIIKHMED